MAELQRITTEYVDVEDRIRVAGEVSGGAPVLLWLTQRLLQRLLPVLLQGLEGQGADTLNAEVLHGFAQQAARAELRPEPPVQAGQASRAWLVLSVDITHTQSPDAVRLSFKGAHDHPVSLTMASTPLRQWLGILYDACQKAGWSLQGWPPWLQECGEPAFQQAVVLH